MEMKLDFMFHLFYSNDVLNSHTFWPKKEQNNKRTEFLIKQMKSAPLQAHWSVCAAAFHLESWTEEEKKFTRFLP